MQPGIDEVVAALEGQLTFWKSGTRQSFRRAAEKMLAAGFSRLEVIQILTELYGAVADDHGG